jgi:large subunit ribosomal protein L4
MLKAQVFSAKGIKSGEVSLPSFSEDKLNLFTLSQAIRVYEDRRHPGLSKVKTRAEINATKKKLYRQKGTGGARHGAKSAPIFVGGGVAHGPKGIKRRLVLPQKLARKALKIAVSLKVKEEELFVVSGAKGIVKTKDAQALLEKLSKVLGKTIKRATFAYSPENSGVYRATKNIQGFRSVAFADLNAHSVYLGGVVLLDKDALEAKKSQIKVETPKVAEKEVKAKPTKKIVKKTK